MFKYEQIPCKPMKEEQVYQDLDDNEIRDFFEDVAGVFRIQHRAGQDSAYVVEREN